MNIEIKEKLYKKIEEYCKLNLIEDIPQFINKLLEKEYTIEVYGDKPGGLKSDVIEKSKEIKKEEKVEIEKEEEIITSDISNIEIDNVQKIEHYDNGIEMVIMENMQKRKRRILK